MTYPPQGGYPDDPTGNAPDPHSPFGYPDQPASPAPYTPQPGGGWPDAPHQYPDSPTPQPAQNPPMSGPPMSGPPMSGPPQQPGYGPPPPYGPPAPVQVPQSSSGGAPVGWIVGGIAAVLVVIAGIVGVIIFTSSSEPGESANNSSTTTEEGKPSQSPTDVVNAYYDAIRSHDVNGAYKTLCQAMQGTESEFYGSYGEETFWATVDSSTYTVGEETIKDDQNATVKIKQDLQGQTYDFYADLKIEDEEWKICFWGTPS